MTTRRSFASCLGDFPLNVSRLEEFGQFIYSQYKICSQPEGVHFSDFFISISNLSNSIFTIPPSQLGLINGSWLGNKLIPKKAICKNCSSCSSIIIMGVFDGMLTQSRVSS